MNNVTSFSPQGPLLTPQQWELLTALAVTLKPEQALWVSGYLAGLSFERSPPAAPSAPRSEPRTRDAALTGTAAREITILYGSETGNSAALALALGDAALSLGLSALCRGEVAASPSRQSRAQSYQA